MPGTRYRRGKTYAADMAVYSRLMSETNGETVERLKANLARALREEVTERQREVLFLYYERRLNMKEIAELLGIDKSTVSRTIKRGGESAAAVYAVRWSRAAPVRRRP